jgi:hypothetical protein
MSRTDTTQAIIESFGYRPDAPPDPAQVLPVLFARSGQSGADWAVRLERSVGLYSIISGGFAPLGVLANRHGMHGIEPAPANSLLSACSTFQSMMQLLQVRMQLAQIDPKSDPVLDALHARRRDGADFPCLDGLTLPADETEWSEICSRGLLPHPDSLTGLPQRLQLIGLALRNFTVAPRDIAILDGGELLGTLPAGIPFGCPVIGNGVYDYRWTLEDGQLGADERRRLTAAGFRLVREQRWTCVCIDSTKAYEFTGVVGPANDLCPTLRWPTAS